MERCLIANVENEVCSAETLACNPELFHYTNPAAFQSIGRSQSLWCSHYKEMADKEEIQLLREHVAEAVAPRMD